MVNLLALILVVASLAAAARAGFWSPGPESTTANEDNNNNVIVKEGHRVVVIEYDKDGHENTKVLISPDHDDSRVIRKPESVSLAEDKLASKASGAVRQVKDKVKEAASVLPNLGQGITTTTTTTTSGDGERHGAKEVIGDALGKVSEKSAGAVGRGMEKVEKEMHSVEGGARELKDALGAACGKGNTAGETLEKTGESVKGTAKKAGDDLAANVSQAAEEVASKAKSGAKSTYSLVRYFIPTGRLSWLMNVVNLLGFSTAYGMCMWVTFISSNVLAASLLRQQFEVVQSKIYPVYFRAMAFSIGLAFLGHALIHPKQLVSSKAEMLQGCNLLGSLLATLLNYAYLEPRATKVMFERMKFEKEEGRGIAGGSTRTGEAVPRTAGPSSSAAASERVEPEGIRTRVMKLGQRLKKLNTYSSFVNLLTLMGLTWHLVYLAQRLHMPC